MFLKIFVLCIIFISVQPLSRHPILIVVSYDAFRYNYFDKDVPYMQKLRKSGTYADYLVNVFPTKTFPNHQTIATGLYPENHGVIMNEFYDKKNDKIFGIGYDLYHHNNDVIPIWRRNEDMGGDRYSGSMMWPGSDFPYQNKNITYVKDFDPEYSWSQRIDQVISWIEHPNKPANLVMLYIEEPDTHGHIYGPDSEQVKTFLRKLDNITEYLQDKLKEHNLLSKVNVIHVSDHGMLSVPKANFINVTKHLEPGTYRFVGASPIRQLFPLKGKDEDVYYRLHNASLQKDSHFSVFKKSEYLPRWHFNHSRAPPILVIADEGYALDDLITASEIYAKSHNITITSESQVGIHGYDYIVPSMRPIFFANGPAIKPNNKVAPFATVDLYNLFCRILRITPNANNGTQTKFENILNMSTGKYSIGTIGYVMEGGVIASLLLISLAVMITLYMVKRQQNITTAAALNKRFPLTTQSVIESQSLLESDEA